MTLTLICPHDRQPLSEISNGLSCGICGRKYSIRDGVVCTLDRPDDFYEGTYENRTLFLPRSERFWHTWPLWLINSGYVWEVRHFVPAGATLLELGCAGGVRYFGQRYRAIGCDLSFSSLKKVEFYECKVQADASVCIPLPDNSVDAVVSSYFWEHIPPEIKPHILFEVRRILRPAGKLIFLYDVETKNPLIRHYKSKDPSLYQRLFIAGDGHFGYQCPAENLKMFGAAELHILVHKGMEKTLLQSPSAYTKLAQYPVFGRRLIAFASRLGRRPLFVPFTVLMRLVDTLICPWLPVDWARIDLVVCEKAVSKKALSPLH
jgi:SAM-dependent methyltransferase